MQSYKLNIRLLFMALLAMLTLLPATGTEAARKTNSQVARSIFNRTYNMVFGPDGCSLNYSVNIIGLYKTKGSIYLKGKKAYFKEARYEGWRDGRYYWSVDKKKKEIELRGNNEHSSDKYASKFTWSLDDFDYVATQTDEDYIITLTAHKKVKGVKKARVYIDKRTRAPKSVKVKVMFFWCTVHINNFHAGISDERVFNFPRNRFPGYELKDMRGK